MADMDAAEAKRAAWRVRLESERRDREALLRTLRDVQARRNLQVLSRGVELASRRHKPVLRLEPASPLRHVQKKEIARPLVESLSQARKAYNKKMAETQRSFRASLRAAKVVERPVVVRVVGRRRARDDVVVALSRGGSASVHGRAQLLRTVASAPAFVERAFAEPATFVSPGPDPLAPFVRRDNHPRDHDP